MEVPNLRSLRDKADSVVQTWLLQHTKQRRFRILGLLVATFLISSAIWTYFNLMVVSNDRSIFGSSKSTPSVIVDPGKSLIPEKIWQIIFKDEDCDPEDLRETKSWLAKNINAQYTLLGKQKSDEFVHKHYANEPRVIDVYEALWNTGMKSDLLRYLVLNIEGGVYSDIDTVAIKPVSKWVPPYLRDRVRLIAGIEYDRLDGPGWVGMKHYVQFGQWTFAGAPGHPVFRRLIDRAVEGVEELARAHGVSVTELRPSKHTDVVNTTGPIAFTDMIIEEIQKVDPLFNDTKEFSPMSENLVIGDMLLLPIDAFGMGQSHSGSTKDGTIPKNALVQHLFWGHWTKGDQMDKNQKEPPKKPQNKEEDGDKNDDKDKQPDNTQKEDEKKDGDDDKKKETENDDSKEDVKKTGNDDDEAKNDAENEDAGDG